MSLSKVRDLDEKFVHTVFGYIRQEQKQANNKLKIPDDVTRLCLKYYLIQQYFANHDISQTVIAYPRMINRKRSIELRGNDVIDLDDTSITKYIWKFKLLSFGIAKLSRNEIGLISEKLYRFMNGWGPTQYSLKFGKEKPPTFRPFRDLGIVFKKNDIFTLVFDVEKLAIGFAINDEDIIYKKDWRNDEVKRDIQYLKEKQLKILCVLPTGASVKLIEFDAQHKS